MLQNAKHNKSENQTLSTTMSNSRYINKILLTLMTTVLISVMESCGGPTISTANSQMARGEYFEASRTYRKIYNSLTKKTDRPLRGEIAYKLGECHRKLGQSAKAAAAYQNAIRYGYPDSTAILWSGEMLHAQGKYDAAEDAYEKYLEQHPQNARALSGLRGARRAKGQKDVISRYVVKNAKLLNSRRAEYSPAYAGDVLYFTTTNEKATGADKSEVTGMKRGDVWYSRKNERGERMRPEPAEGELNSEHDEGVISFGPDGNTMYLTRSDKPKNADEKVAIYVSQRRDAKWSAPVRLDVIEDTIYNYGHPSVSPDGEWLYFTSDRPGMGGYDICRINLRSSSSKIENMGEWINTHGDEMFPYVLTDSILFFASNGHAGLGGLDLFRATQTPSGGWKVENLGAPMNSAADDFGIAYETPDREKGYFSSNRGDARGYDHLYSFELPDLKINISGMVLDKDEEPVANAVIRIVGDDGSNQKAVAKNDGSFSFPLQRGVSYVMLAGAKGYLNAKQEFTSDVAEEDAEYNVNFSLASLNKPNIVENIFYDFDRATLRPESKSALDGLVAMLRDNPNITIEMASHTDRVGSDQYNIKLSERRAKAVVDYLINAGIAAERLQAQGYGKSRPKIVTKRVAREFPQFEEGRVLDEEYVNSLGDEDKAAADQINRRTEFEILSLVYGLY